ncbi:MAG: aquaporin family protein [Verrucomicrobia bacterium]|nr:aquaporin family protein [Verrucomicrobiota bacterium]
MRPRPFLLGWLVGEFVGTFLLVLLGCGSVCTAVLTSAQLGTFQVAALWGSGVALAIFLTAGLSGAHLNPAITLALAVWRGFPWGRVPRYLAAQFGGAFIASLLLFVVYGGLLDAYEKRESIVRGAPGSEASAMVFGEFFPNPHGRPLHEADRAAVPPSTAFLVETLGTALLALVIFAVSDPKNPPVVHRLSPLLIGLALTVLIALFSPLTMAAFNPARDLAPRVFSSFAGWGKVVFTANGPGWLTVYVIAPLVGAITGGGVYQVLRAVRPAPAASAARTS